MPPTTGSITITRWGAAFISGVYPYNGTFGWNLASQDQAAQDGAGGSCSYFADAGAFDVGISFIFDENTPCFSLDGNSPVSFNDLPAGIQFKNGVFTSQLTGGLAFPDIIACSVAMSPPYIPAASGFSSTVVLPFSSSDLFGGVSISPTTFIGISLQFQMQGNNNILGPGAGVGAYNVSQFTMDYEIIKVSAPFTIENPDVPVYVGDKVKIVTNPATINSNINPPIPGILNGVEEVELSYINPLTGLEEFITITETTNWWNTIYKTGNNYWFTVPFGLPKTKDPIIITIKLIFNPAFFTGSVLVGTLQILFADASGIYSLKPGATDDSLYFRNGLAETISSIIPADILETKEVLEEDLFDLLPYPRKILAQIDVNEDDTELDFLLFLSFEETIIIKEVEIPSPFIRTAFLP